MGLTTPTSTQTSSPIASPALSFTDDRKRNKSESEDNQSQRHRSVYHRHSRKLTFSALFRNDSGTNHVSSPKNPSQQSPSVLSKVNLNSAPSSSSALSASAPSQFAYPTTNTTTLPVLQYSAIVSQNNLSSPSAATAASSTNPITSKQQHVLSPPSKQPSRQLSNGTGTHTNDSTVTSTSNLPSSSVTNSHPPSLLSSNNDRTGILNQHILNNISQISAPVSTSNSTQPTYSGSNIPSHDSSSSSSSSSNAHSMESSLPMRSSASDHDRPMTSINHIPASMMNNGSSDGHSSTESTFGNSTMDEPPTTNGGGVIGQLASGIPINPEHHPHRYVPAPAPPASTMTTPHPQQTIANGRVPLTQAEVRMLNRLNSAYTKLPSLLESERQR